MCCTLSYTKKKTKKAQGFLCFVQLNQRELKAALHRLRSLVLLCTLDQKSPFLMGFNGDQAHRLYPYNAGITQRQGCFPTSAPPSCFFMPPSRACATKSVQSTPTAQLTTWHLQTTTKMEEGELCFASCSSCCYEGPKHLIPSQQGPSGMCFQSLNPPPHHPFPGWRWKRANAVSFCKWKTYFLLEPTWKHTLFPEGAAASQTECKAPKDFHFCSAIQKVGYFFFLNETERTGQPRPQGPVPQLV